MTGIFRRRRLPHWDVQDATYFVTTCLAGSVPAAGVRELEVYRRDLDGRPCPVAMTETDWTNHKNKLLFAKLDQWLDGKPAVRHLQDSSAAAEVRRSLYHFAETRYHVLAYVVMPSHLHWVFHPTADWIETLPEGSKARTPREVVMHSLKSFTSNACNKILKLTGTFWQDESYDHWVRDDAELLRIIEYVEQNPVKAGLAQSAEQFILSSAYDRSIWGIPVGEPLIPPSG